MNYEDIRFKHNGYIKALNAALLIQKYELNPSEDILKELKVNIKYFSNYLLTLPSGRYGDALALALELNSYVTAKKIIDNLDELSIDLNKCSCDDNNNYMSAKEEYIYSQVTFDEARNFRVGESIEQYEKYLDIYERTQQANKDLEKVFINSEDDVKKLTKARER